MDTGHKRYRAFISYSQRDKAIARRLHRALETYRIPAGVNVSVGPDRALGRFFRDDDEMGASQSLGAALEGALDDSENLIVICSPAAARSKWVDAEVRHFKRRGDARVFAVIAEGEPHADDPGRECFPPALKVKIGADGNPTGEPDEPRAPDLSHEGMQRVRAQLAAGLLDLPFDELWRRDRRRAMRNRLMAAAAGLVVAAVLGVMGYGWLGAQRESKDQAARQAVALARTAVADGRIGDALNRLAPFLSYSTTSALVERPLRALLGWISDPSAALEPSGIQAARLRDATVLLDPGREVYDVSDIGLELKRLIRSRDGRRLVALGDQRVVVFDADSGQRLGQVDNDQVEWLGHAFEAPSGLIVVTGAILGPTNGSVWPFALSISADGKTVERNEIEAHMFWSSAVGITPNCAALLVATEGDARSWQVGVRALAAEQLNEPAALPSFAAADDSDTAGITGLSPHGSAFATQDAFMGYAELNPFTEAGCPALGMDDGFTGGYQPLQGAHVLSLEPSLGREAAERWTAVAVAAPDTPAPADYKPNCTEAEPCPVIGGRTGDRFVLDDLPPGMFDKVGLPPAPRWSRRADAAAATTSPDAPIYFEHRVYNSGHQIALCRPRQGRDVCLNLSVLGEDHLELPFLRSADGRYLYWPFGGAVYDLETLQPLTASRAIPGNDAMHFDFEPDRPGLTLALNGRLVSFFGDATTGAGAEWTRTDDERASPRFGVLAQEEEASSLLVLAALGGRQYLAVRKDGVLARLDAASGQEVWRMTAVGLGEIQDVQLNPERRHALLMGKSAWRMFRLDDGFAVSGLLVPPPMLEQPKDATTCQLDDALGPEGELVARCGEGAFAWRPEPYEGDIAPRLERLRCATEVKASALDTIRRCYVGR